ncbi:protein adenylyltransferase SelO family protein [Corynebacterium sp.]|uniref:protein adenylyltransferase SelO family protein n=1 Tax=Corynebacterium sp. TaxID=1720 RepID=UPI0026DBE3AB|nr:protein adenylyltransferase SelO family protein [Corynebacterium sp.]MDO5032477.1 protein adenylyltransferase SelO family protein [Corynebacterium sp.]
MTMIHHDFASALPRMAVAARGEEQPAPRLVQLNEELACQLGLDPQWLRSEEGLDFLLGRGSEPAHALAYAGFQFGQFNPSMGDGRALLLGEVTGPTTAYNPAGLWDLHAKGTGPTPFSRWGADGRGTLRSMLREYLNAEAMHALGIPTTRSLAVIATGRKIQRQVVEEAGVHVRVAASHLRVGSFHYAALHPELLEPLASYAIARHTPGSTARELFTGVMHAQVRTVAAWQHVGFIHGVMNTDNTTISGETIDYGPCAFLGTYDPNACFSSIDTQGRYRFGAQPEILGWNLARLAESLLPLLGDTPDEALAWAQEEINTFGERFAAAERRELAARLGIPEDEPQLAADYLALLRRYRPDLTLANAALASASPTAPTYWHDEDFLARYARQATQAHVPRVIPRPHLVEQALVDRDAFAELLTAVTHPFDTPANPALMEPRSLEGYLTYCGT